LVSTIVIIFVNRLDTIPVIGSFVADVIEETHNNFKSETHTRNRLPRTLVHRLFMERISKNQEKAGNLSNKQSWGFLMD